MYATFVATVFAFLVALVMAREIPKEEEKTRQLAGEVEASNFLSYRSSVVAYLATHSGTTGTITDTSLSFPLGYIRNSKWTNTVSTGTLYTYSETAPTSAMIAALKKFAPDGVPTVGIKQSDGTLTNLRGSYTGITVPASIPTGSIVFIGT